MQRFPLRALPLLALFASGCVAHVHRPPYGGAPPPPVQAVQYSYWDSHPIPDDWGGGWCPYDGAHVHDFAPDSFYAYQDNAYFYRGPRQIWYFDIHPIPGGGGCDYRGRHSHDYFPPTYSGSTYGWDRGQRVYRYQNYRHDASPGYSRPPPAYRAPPARHPGYSNAPPPSYRPPPPAMRPVQPSPPNPGPPGRHDGPGYGNNGPGRNDGPGRSNPGNNVTPNPGGHSGRGGPPSMGGQGSGRDGSSTSAPSRSDSRAPSGGTRSGPPPSRSSGVR